MSELAIPALTLNAYLQNVVCARPMDQIAEALKCHKSTVSRRITHCESLRDHPEWAAVLNALEDSLETWPETALPTRRHILAALDLTAEEVRRQIRGHLTLLRAPGTEVLAGDMPMAVILQGDHKIRIDKDILLAALAFGWITPKDQGRGQVRKFEITPSALEVQDSEPAPPDQPSPRIRYGRAVGPVEAAVRWRKQHILTETHLRAAQDLEIVHATRDGVNAERWRALTQALPPRLVTALEEVCGKHTRFEALEARMGLPARSAKLLVAVALEAALQARIVE